MNCKNYTKQQQQSANANTRKKKFTNHNNFSSLSNLSVYLSKTYLHADAQSQLHLNIQ